MSIEFASMGVDTMLASAAQPATRGLGAAWVAFVIGLFLTLFPHLAERDFLQARFARMIGLALLVAGSVLLASHYFHLTPPRNIF